MPLNLNTSADFLKKRVDATLAAQKQMASTWMWVEKPLADWESDSLQLDTTQPGTIATVAVDANSAADRARAALDARLAVLHAQTTRVVGVMRARAGRNSGHAPVVNKLHARGDSRQDIADEATALLSAWKEEFGGADFTPVPAIGEEPAITFDSFQALLHGVAPTPKPVATRSLKARQAVLPAADAALSLRALEQGLSDAETVERRHVGALNALLARAEKDAQDWYAEALNVFEAGTDLGDVVRGIPTTSDYNPPAPAPPAPPSTVRV